VGKEENVSSIQWNCILIHVLRNTTLRNVTKYLLVHNRSDAIMHKQVNNRTMFAHWCTSERETSNVWQLEHIKNRLKQCVNITDLFHYCTKWNTNDLQYIPISIMHNGHINLAMGWTAKGSEFESQ
jgi:hypothetical protein